MLSTTFALLRKAGACPARYKRLAKHLHGVSNYGPNTPIPLTVVLASNGLDDTLWCLRAVLPEHADKRDRLARLFACDCVERVLSVWEAEFPADTRPRDAIATARRFAMGNATTQELLAAKSVAESVAWSTAKSAAWSTAELVAKSAAWSTAELVARLAAESAAKSAARLAAESVDELAAWAAEREWQRSRFVDYLYDTVTTSPQAQ